MRLVSVLPTWCRDRASEGSGHGVCVVGWDGRGSSPFCVNVLDRGVPAKGCGWMCGYAVCWETKGRVQTHHPTAARVFCEDVENNADIKNNAGVVFSTALEFELSLGKVLGLAMLKTRPEM